ncbi:MAG: magnesium transporter CorA family protein [Patescibacteria group bacterium]|jgi:magnesium transporter
MRKIEFKNFVWLDITSPSEKDIEYLSKHYHFHHLSLEDVVSTVQRPKLDQYGEYLFLVFHLPRYIKQSFRTVPSEIDIFLGKGYLITIHREAVKPIEELYLDIKQRSPEILTESPALLLYELLDKTFDYCFPMLDRIGQKIDRIEDNLYDNQTRKILEEIALVERDIINFRKIMNPQRYVLKDLEAIKSKYIEAELDVYFDDIVDKIERIWDLLDNYKEVSEVLQHTSESIVTHKLNDVIRILTIFSVLMLPLTVITGFYGMNIVGLPFANHSLAGEIIIGIMLLVVLAMLVFFNRRRWL